MRWRGLGFPPVLPALFDAPWTPLFRWRAEFPPLLAVLALAGGTFDSDAWASSPAPRLPSFRHQASVQVTGKPTADVRTSLLCALEEGPACALVSTAQRAEAGCSGRCLGGYACHPHVSAVLQSATLGLRPALLPDHFPRVDGRRVGPDWPYPQPMNRSSSNGRLSAAPLAPPAGRASGATPCPRRNPAPRRRRCWRYKVYRTPAGAAPTLRDVRLTLRPGRRWG